MTVFAFGAHPDDIEYSCFGTLAKLEDKKYLFIYTDGELTGKSAQRRKEALNSAKLIDAKAYFRGLPDGNLPITCRGIAELIDLVKKHKPHTVYTPYPEDTHQDHRAVTRIVMSACRTVPNILYYELPSTLDFQPNYYVDVTETFPLKIKAITKHLSQREKPTLQPDVLENKAIYHANRQRFFGRRFEAFMVRRIIR